MGSGCLCGNANFNQASWQANTGPSLGLGQGYYSGAVNNLLFDSTTINDQGGPGCGNGCGVCYDIITTGVNSYNPSIAGGSYINMMVVDSCYNPSDSEKWCQNNSKDGSTVDRANCNAHFDIQTDPSRSGVPVVGHDSTTWECESNVP